MRDKTEDVKRKGQSWGKQEDGVQARQRCWPWRGVEGLEGKVREVERTLAWWALLSQARAPCGCSEDEMG